MSAANAVAFSSANFGALDLQLPSGVGQLFDEDDAGAAPLIRLSARQVTPICCR
ncbi:hypothetical protein [Nonomuraea sp. CA-141351]|uniref:hypothetical protein n=1 Tax=Nonomuraea sp. CA-141351 TaxID=3239996 RepID=UPI003D9204FC